MKVQEALNQIMESAALDKASGDLNYIFEQIGTENHAARVENAVEISCPGEESVRLGAYEAIDYIAALVERYADNPQHPNP